ncbi:MAG TPA: hypothetical protein VJT09_16685 [Pyrinomonadaceae bacterium]|nr:hypothetical protein [Pyrinomonadaceae bacterium]
MTPHEVKRIVEDNFSGIVSKERNNPDGRAFYYKEIRQGRDSTRIARATRAEINNPTMFKRAVSYKLTRSKKDAEVAINGTEQVRELFEQELKLWVENFQ